MFICGDKVSFIPGWVHILNEAKNDDLEFLIFLYLLNVGIAGMRYHAKFIQCWG